jgi:acetyl-CoA C-acetyltransferase
MRPDDLAAHVVRAVLDKVPQVEAEHIEDLILGCANPAGQQGFNLARVTAILAGLDRVPGVTVNRYCSSSLQAIRIAGHAIRADEGDCFVAAGVESVSSYKWTGPSENAHNPAFKAAGQRSKLRADGAEPPWAPAGGLPDAYIAMGQTAENVAEFEGITRQEMDEFAARSQQLAVESQDNGFFDAEITPVTLPDGSIFSRDDGPRPGTTVETLAALQPAFRPDGAVTAGNSCPLNDGAAAVIVMSDTKAKQLGLQPLARIVASGVSALNPEIMGLGPIEACQQALRRAGMSIDDIDLVEINEAFAAQVIPSARHLGIDIDKLNVHGGAIAIGHPFGMTGARMMTTLIHGLEHDDKSTGLATMCVGGGQGLAMIIERYA